MKRQLSFSVSVSVSALFALAAFACAIDDRELHETHDDNGGGSQGARGGTDTGGVSPSGGSTPTGGKGGSTPTGGKGGSTPTGGKGGAAGKGGSGGFGAAEDCAGDPLDLDEALVRACLFQVGCSPFLPPASLSFCITNQRLGTFPQDDCGTGATTCDGFLECLGQGYYDPTDCSSGEAAYCETATLAVTCNRYPYAIDCSKSGGVCGTYTDDSGTVRARCHQPTLDPCTDSPDTSQCGATATDIAYTCIGGQAYGTDCAATGSECRDGTCYYVLPTCATPGSSCGSATRLDLCYSNNDLARYDCAQGLGCEESTATSADCVAPGCTASTCAESCDGTELTFCYGGVPVTLDCTDYGFRQCVFQTPSSGGDPLAFCAFPESAPDRACEIEDTSTACTACALTECCSEWTACVDDSDCVGYLNCANDCAGVLTCIDMCESMYPRGVAIYSSFLSCRTLGCPSDC